MKIQRTLAALGTSALLALSLTACGGSDDSSDSSGGDDSSSSSASGADGSPDDASTEDFCGAFIGLLGVDSSTPKSDQVDAVHGVADDLEEVGTPSDATDDERAGFVVFVQALHDVDESTIDDLTNSENPEDIGLSGDDADNADAFATYAGKTCQDALTGGAPSDGAS